ncbi:hypothetical protein DAPPUDRAFT_312612 [Daphnia pulex]|uniref:60S ribosomal protein L41 n=1 Tax=Daphnia pulex TaxID=6669 RepID=E9FZN6_DAPPU|nr:hypothetical protein DAPPUDRAFT_312612 [Daphnia pulex]|eukprot:EFX87089.1 hypothetical protein DAPPUDRAFT_312612 [Daphnia pulex]
MLYPTQHKVVVLSAGLLRVLAMMFTAKLSALDDSKHQYLHCVTLNHSSQQSSKESDCNMRAKWRKKRMRRLKRKRRKMRARSK